MDVLYELKGSNKHLPLPRVENIPISRLLALPNIAELLEFTFPSTTLRIGAASTSATVRIAALERLQSLLADLEKDKQQRYNSINTGQVTCYKYNISTMTAEWKQLRHDMNCPPRTRHVSVFELFKHFCTRDAPFDQLFLVKELLRTAWMLDLAYINRSHNIDHKQYTACAKSDADEAVLRQVQQCVDNYVFYKTAWECPPGSFSTLHTVFEKGQESLDAALQPSRKRKRGTVKFWKDVPGFSIKLVCKRDEQNISQNIPATTNSNGIHTSKVTDGSRVLDIPSGTITIPTVKMVVCKFNDNLMIRCHLRSTNEKPHVQRIDSIHTLTINADGSASGTDCARELLPLLHIWNRNIVDITQKLGNLLGYCLLCGNQMSRTESLERGVGDICMKRFNLANIATIALECTDGERIVNGVQLRGSEEQEAEPAETVEDGYVTLRLNGGEITLPKSHWFIQKSDFFVGMMELEEGMVGGFSGERTLDCSQFTKLSLQRLLDTGGVIDRLYQPLSTEFETLLEDLTTADFFGLKSPSLLRTIALVCAGKPEHFYLDSVASKTAN